MWPNIIKSIATAAVISKHKTEHNYVISAETDHAYGLLTGNFNKML